MKIQVLENKSKNKYSDKKNKDGNKKDILNTNEDTIEKIQKKNISFGRLPERYRSKRERKEELARIDDNDKGKNTNK